MHECSQTMYGTILHTTYPIRSCHIMRQVTQLLSGLPRDPETGFASFHDAQKLVVAYRDKHIARFKVIFPDPVPGRRAAGGAKASRSKKHKSSSRRPRTGGLTLPTEAERGEIRGEQLEGALTKGGSGSYDDSPLGPEGRGRCDVDMGGRRRRRAKFSADVAPAEMFIKDAGFSPAGIANRVSQRGIIFLYRTELSRFMAINHALFHPRFADF